MEITQGITPLPWQRNIPPASHYPTLFSGRNTHVLTLAGCDDDEMEANMRYTLAACNNLPAMYDALAAAIQTIEQLIPEPSARGVANVVLFQLRAALAAARGEVQS